MDDGIGNLLYIILLIVLGIVSAINQNNKKKQAQRKRSILNNDPQPEVQRPKTPFQSMLESIKEEFVEEEPYKETIEDEAVAENKEEVISVKNEYLKSKTESKEYKEREKIKLKIEKEKKEKLEEAYELMRKLDAEEDETIIFKNNLLDTPQDLKKAIILSEILNRKY